MGFLRRRGPRSGAVGTRVVGRSFLLVLSLPRQIKEPEITNAELALLWPVYRHPKSVTKSHFWPPI
jgi:hypothetical protein